MDSRRLTDGADIGWGREKAPHQIILNLASATAKP